MASLRRLVKAERVGDGDDVLELAERKIVRRNHRAPCVADLDLDANREARCDVIPTGEGLDALLVTIKAVEDLGDDEGKDPRTAGPRTSWHSAPASLRDLARGLEAEMQYARRHAVRMGRFDLVPLLDRLSESTEARLAEHFGERHKAENARRFRLDSARLRRALREGA
jgi:hypothetical protein